MITRRLVRRLHWTLPLALSACASAAPPSPPPASPTPPAALPFIEDDYGAALAKAKADHKLLFVDAWAPWCHSCLAMRAFTFRDPKVRARAGDLVWASIDTEKPVNAAWVAAHPMRGWPTLFVVDPEGDRTLLAWTNSASADELLRLLDMARDAAHHEGVLAKADARAFEGNAAAAAGKPDEAIAAWRDALAMAPEGWTGRTPAAQSLIDGLFAKKDMVGCVEAADRELPRIARGSAQAATLALMCAEALPDGPSKRPELDKAIERAHKLAVDEAEPMLQDDRSGLYESVVDALDEGGRHDEARTIALEWSSFLDGQAAHAPDATARAVYDAHRLDAYLFLGTPERAVPMLQATARDFPGDYNPPARLARAYLAMKRHDDALAAIDHALSLAYGPRALRLYATKADVLEARGDRAAAAAALKEGVLRAGRDLPPRYAPLAKDLLERAQKLEGPR